MATFSSKLSPIYSESENESDEEVSPTKYHTPNSHVSDVSDVSQYHTPKELIGKVSPDKSAQSAVTGKAKQDGSTETSTTEVVSWNAKSYPNIHDLRHKYLAGYILKERNSGSFNLAESYIKGDQKLVFRIAKAPIFEIIPGQSEPKLIFDSDKYDSPEEQLDELERTEYNWVTASQLELAPHLYFTGYATRVSSEHGKTYLYACNISEGYSMDLGDYYKNYDTSRNINENDRIIQRQLTDLLNKTSLSPFYTICFDIKPKNCVIRTSDMKVKLIDWDADYCLQKPMLKKRDGQNAIMSGILSNLVMANHFYTYIGKNIFAEYFIDLRDNHRLEEKRAALEYLFCNDDQDNYKFFGDHYYQMGTNYRPCPELFNILYERCFVVNPSGSPFDRSTRGGKTKVTKAKKRRGTKKNKKRKTKKGKKSKKSKKRKTKNRKRKHRKTQRK